MTSRYEKLTSGIVAFAALVFAATFVYVQVIKPMRAPDPAGPVRVPDEDWETLANGELRIGPQAAPVVLVAFADFQCPFCRIFHTTLEKLIAEMPHDVSLVYRHFPLPIHPHAEHAARMATCAADQGKFGEMARILYASQDSLGTTPWGYFVHAAGISDTLEHARCLARDSTGNRVQRDLRAAQKLGLIGTPTLLINGWLYRRPVGLDLLRNLAKELVSGRRPSRGR